MNHRSQPRGYVTDIRIPNLDGMTRGELVAYADATAAKVEQAEGATKDWLNLASKYARTKAKAMELRKTGEIAKALKYERECENIYGMIPARMKW